MVVIIHGPPAPVKSDGSPESTRSRTTAGIRGIDPTDEGYTAIRKNTSLPTYITKKNNKINSDT